MLNILVYGATGVQASPLLKQLQSDNHKVFALTRSKAKVAAIPENNYQHVVEGSLTHAADLNRLTQGMDIVMLNLPFFSENEAGSYAIDAAKRAGVKQIIWNANGEVPQITSDRVKMNVRLENMERLAASGIAYVVFQPTIYLENLLMQETARRIRENNRIEMVAAPDATLPWMSAWDISAAMVKSMGKPELNGKVMTVKGPGWDGNYLASAFSSVLGRKITYHQIDLLEHIKRINIALGEGHGEEIMGLAENQDSRPSREATFPPFTALDATQVLNLNLLSLESWIGQHQDIFKQ